MVWSQLWVPLSQAWRVAETVRGSVGSEVVSGVGNVVGPGKLGDRVGGTVGLDVGNVVGMLVGGEVGSAIGGTVLRSRLRLWLGPTVGSKMGDGVPVGAAAEPDEPGD